MPAKKAPARRAPAQRTAVTLDTIAAKAGVSKSAVSLALNGRGRLSDEVRTRIRAIAEETGYKSKHKNTNDASTERQVRVGVLLDRRFFRPNESYFTHIVRGVEQEASRRGYQILFTALSEEQLARAGELPFADPTELTALIVVGITHPEFLKQLDLFNIPTTLVACGRLYDHRHDVVVHDDFEGMELVFDHLTRLGHRRIAFIGGAMEHLSGAARMRAYKINMEEMEGGGDGALVEIVEGETNQAAGERGCTALLAREQPPTAIVCVTDEIASGTIRTIQRMGLKVPGDISVVGFDNKPFAELLNPPLTTVQISCEEMGRVATELLSLRISGLSVSHALRVFVGSELIERSSTTTARKTPTTPSVGISTQSE